MEFRNHTPFHAIAFQSVDHSDERFHVVALRVNYSLSPTPNDPVAVPNEPHGASLACTHTLVLNDEQAPLCLEDEAFGEHNQSSVRRESDLAPCKPRCDVIINASAHAPSGQPARHFSVRLTLRRPNTHAPLPAPLEPLNPFMPVDDNALAEWQREVEHAKRTTLPGTVLIDKTLTVTGPRQFKKRWLPIRLLQGLVHWGTFTLVRPTPWKLTWPQAITTQPIRYEHAYGGQCRINQQDNRHLARTPKEVERLADHDTLAQRVPKKHRLTPEQLSGHPDAEAPAALQPVAHTVCMTNPVGIGFAETWFLKAAKLTAIPAPQIESPDAPITARQFWQAAQAKQTPEDTRVPAPAGFGCLGRPWTPRLQKAGTYNQTWLDTRWPYLPEDFDFAYWNSAPEDQQTDYLRGDEILELTNLVAHDTPGAIRDAAGNTMLRFALPGHVIKILVREVSGRMYYVDAPIDTLQLDLDGQPPVVSATYRFTLNSEPAVRVLEAHAFFNFPECAEDNARALRIAGTPASGDETSHESKEAAYG